MIHCLIEYLYKHTRDVENVLYIERRESEVLKHPIIVNLSIALIESISIIHLQFSIMHKPYPPPEFTILAAIMYINYATAIFCILENLYSTQNIALH